MRRRKIVLLVIAVLAAGVSPLPAGTIEVGSDITTNQIWTADNIYHIIDCINIEALLVIEPGTIIEFASGACITVGNGGTLISSGTPDNLIIYTCDFLYPDWGTY
jgi:hypothetical protein